MIRSRRRAAAGSQYAIIVGMVGVVALVAVTATGGSVRNLLGNTSNVIGAATNGAVGAAPPAAPAPDTTPDAFSFAELTAQAFNTVVNSTAVVVSGFDGALNATVAGDGAPEISVAGGDFSAGPAAIASGQTIRVRLTTANAPSTARTATVTIGGVSAGFTAATGSNAVVMVTGGGTWPAVRDDSRPHPITDGYMNSFCQSAGYSRGLACNDQSSGCNLATHYVASLRAQITLATGEGFHLTGCRTSSCGTVGSEVCGYHSWPTNQTRWCTNNGGSNNDGVSSTRRQDKLDQVWIICKP